MAINVSDVQTGWLYRTANNQERVVLGCNPKGQVVYAVRGGSEHSPKEFDQREASSVERFAAACEEKLRALSPAELTTVIASCHATSVITGLGDCFRP